MPETIAIIQGRMSSSRLPGKVLLDIAGKPMLQHVYERTCRAQSLDAVIVATSRAPADDPIMEFCAGIGASCARGSLHDVLDRYYQAARPYAPELVVRITADCPMIDPSLIDDVVRSVSGSDPHNPVDFAANRLPPPFERTFPIGLDVEVCRYSALQRAWQEATETFHREHVMPYIYEGVRLSPAGEQFLTGCSTRGFNIALLNHHPDHGSLRWTVDTLDDLIFAREIFSRLDRLVENDFTWVDILEIIQNEPELTQINAGVRHKTMTEVDERAGRE